MNYSFEPNICEDTMGLFLPFSFQSNFIPLVSWSVNIFWSLQWACPYVRHGGNSGIRGISCPQRAYSLMYDSEKETNNNFNDQFNETQKPSARVTIKNIKEKSNNHKHKKADNWMGENICKIHV